MTFTERTTTMLLRKGRKEYEFLVVTHRIECSPWDDFVGVFKDYEQLQQTINPRLLETGKLTVWQMNVGDQLGKGIFNFDMGTAKRDFIIDVNNI